VVPCRTCPGSGFGRTASEFFGGVLREHGIDWVANDSLARFEGADGRVQRVVTASGRSLDADMVVMGTGAVPDVMLARSAGLELGETGGIACSSILETSAPGVWAAGDACEYDSVMHRRRLRVEHWEVARAQGAAVAGALTMALSKLARLWLVWRFVHIQPFDRDYARLLIPAAAGLAAGMAAHLLLSGGSWPVDLLGTAAAALAVYIPVLLLAGLPGPERRTARRLAAAVVGRRAE
jgi:hypothetical protein